MNKKLLFITGIIIVLIVISMFLPNFKFILDSETIEDYNLENAFPNLEFDDMTDLHQVPDSHYLAVSEQAGRIMRFSNASDTEVSSVYLDITDKVSGSGEKGLLGFIFHPDFKNNRYLYVDYTTDIDGNLFTRISRFSASQTAVDPTSELIILQVKQPYSNHNAGQIIFGNDGYLYITLGDGGSIGDPEGNAQNLSTLLGSILRIDVDKSENGKNYAIPIDNPFYNNSEGYREEIYAYGFRNPWRISIDRVNNTIWIGDVGQNEYEEIDILQSGGNYGWNIKEGFECYAVENCHESNYSDLIDPIHSYNHEVGISITGGFVYRGQEFEEFYGKYIYGDYGSGRIWVLEYSNGTVKNELLGRFSQLIASFAMDDNDKLYILSKSDDVIYKLVYS